jgi:hypothetical protein
MVKPEGVIIQGTNRNRTAANDLGAEYASSIGRKLQRYELTDTRACQLLVTTHAKSFWVVPAPEAFSRHSGTCRLLGDRKHPVASHTLQVGDFLRVGSVGVVVIETHNGVENRILSEEKIQKIMRDTTNSSGNFLDLGETDGGKFSWLRDYLNLCSCDLVLLYLCTYLKRIEVHLMYAIMEEENVCFEYIYICNSSFIAYRSSPSPQTTPMIASKERRINQQLETHPCATCASTTKTPTITPSSHPANAAATPVTSTSDASENGIPQKPTTKSASYRPSTPPAPSAKLRSNPISS